MLNPQLSDGLFLERLDAFMEKTLNDVQAFAVREDRTFEEVMRHVAEWHSRRLFRRDLVTANDRQGQVQSVLLETSRVLESLQNVSGVHSFFLAVDPSDPGDQGFLGGTVVGREFWRGLRRGGDMGFNSFKIHCLNGTQATYREDDSASTATTTLIPSIGQRSPARVKKSEVYTNVRHALRTASGVRNAEMKWTNHDRLSIYGVRVVGWPESVPHQNPSSLTASQNNLILESLKNGNLQFIRRAEWDEPSVIPVDPVSSEGRSLSVDATSDMPWACEDGASVVCPIDVLDL